jgi:sugar phosphate isomerase/epimerase
MKLGVMQGVLGDPLPDVFAVARDLGFDGVEIDWHSAADAQPGGSLEPARRPLLRGAALSAGVEISSVAAHFLNGGGLASPDEKTQQFAVTVIQVGLQLCRDLGAGALLVPFFGAGTIAKSEAVDRLEKHLKELAPQAERSGVTVAIEHTLSGRDAAAVLDRVGSPRVGDYWDMANCFCFGYDPLEEIAALGHHIARVHAKEYARGDAPVGTRDTPHYGGLNPCRFGEGDVPVPAVIAALRQVGYGSFITLETGAFGDRHQSAASALQVLRSAGGG